MPSVFRRKDGWAADMLRLAVRRVSTALLPPVLRWISRLAPDRYFLGRPLGFKIYLNLSESDAMVARAFGLYERKKVHLFRNTLKPGMTVVDVGANKGYFTLLAAQLTGHQGQVLSFEPAPENACWLRKSIEANGAQGVRVFEVALGDHAGERVLHLGNVSGFHSLLADLPDRTGDTLGVPCDTLDNVLSEAGVTSVDLIKIDVEGAEMEVLVGAEETLRSNPGTTVAIDIHPMYGVDPTQIVNLLKDWGFKIYQPGRTLLAVEHVDDTLTEIVALR